MAHMLRIMPLQDIVQGRGAHLSDPNESPILFQVEFEQVQLALPLSLLCLDLFLGLLVLCIRCTLCFHVKDHSDVEVLRVARNDRHDLAVHCTPIKDRCLKLLKVLPRKVSQATCADRLYPMLDDIAIGAPLLHLRNEFPPSVSILKMEGKDGLVLLRS